MILCVLFNFVVFLCDEMLTQGDMDIICAHVTTKLIMGNVSTSSRQLNFGSNKSASPDYKILQFT